MMKPSDVWLTYACFTDKTIILSDFDLILKTVAVLIGNAVKYGAHPVKIAISLRAVTVDNNEYVGILVAHSGAKENSARSILDRNFFFSALEKIGAQPDVKQHDGITWKTLKLPLRELDNTDKCNISIPDADNIIRAIKTELADVIHPSMFARKYMDI